MASSGIVTYKEYRVCVKMNLSVELFSINICEQSGEAMKRARGRCSFFLGRAWKAKYGISLGNKATEMSFARCKVSPLQGSDGCRLVVDKMLQHAVPVKILKAPMTVVKMRKAEMIPLVGILGRPL